MCGACRRVPDRQRDEERSRRLLGRLTDRCSSAARRWPWKILRRVGGTLGDYALQGGRERPLVDVLKDIIGNVQEMMRSEVRLAESSFGRKRPKQRAPGPSSPRGGAMGMLGVAFLLLCVTQLLYRVMPDWAATLLVGLTLSIIGAAFIAKGRAPCVCQPRPND